MRDRTVDYEEFPLWSYVFLSQLKPSEFYILSFECGAPRALSYTGCPDHKKIRFNVGSISLTYSLRRRCRWANPPS